MSDLQQLPSNLQFLKLGGSLITDKTRAHTHRPAVIERLSDEIAEAYRTEPGLKLVLGHGSGSFGHVPARQYGTRQGVHTPQDWQGFVTVWREAWDLNRLVMDALEKAGLQAVAFSPVASVVTQDGVITRWDLTSLRSALQAGLLPVVYGDVVFDTKRGGTILSTEDLFFHLCSQLRPDRLLLAGIEPGVWADYPVCSRLLSEVTPQSLLVLAGSAADDVTGGMETKVQHSMALARQSPNMEIRIFSGESPGTVLQALLGAAVGTLIKSQ